MFKRCLRLSFILETNLILHNSETSGNMTRDLNKVCFYKDKLPFGFLYSLRSLNNEWGYPLEVTGETEGKHAFKTPIQIKIKAFYQSNQTLSVLYVRCWKVGHSQTDYLFSLRLSPCGQPRIAGLFNLMRFLLMMLLPVCHNVWHSLHFEIREALQLTLTR